MSSSNALDGVFTVAGVRPARDGMTISRDTKLGKENVITFFALGAGTSISQECYDTTSVYIGAEGDASFITGEDAADRVLLMVICLLYQVEHFVVLIANLEQYIQK